MWVFCLESVSYQFGVCGYLESGLPVVYVDFLSSECGLPVLNTWIFSQEFVDYYMVGNMWIFSKICRLPVLNMFIFCRV